MNTDLYYTAINNGYIYIPGYCFQSKINYNVDNKTSIVRNWNFADLGTAINTTKNSANNLDKTIAIQYYGSDGPNSNKYSFFRQFWLDDIKYITSIVGYKDYFGKDAGIFVRNLDTIKTIISNPENTSNYDWINTGLNPPIFNTTDYNMLNNVQFIMVLNNGYFVKSWFTDNLTRLQTYSTLYTGDRQGITDTSPFSISSLNNSLIFQLEKQNTNSNDNNFALKTYQGGKWNYITCNYYGGNNICGFTSSPEYHAVTIINNTNNGNTGLDWNGIRIKQDWSDWNVCSQTAWYHSPKYKIIQPSYDYVFSKLPIVFEPTIKATIGVNSSSILMITNIDKNNPNNIKNLANVSKYNVKLYETGKDIIIKQETLLVDKNTISSSVEYSGLENKKYTWNVTSTSIELDKNTITSIPSMFDVIPVTTPSQPVINSIDSSNNRIDLKFYVNNGGTPITSYNINSYYDGGCSYRQILPNDTNLKTNTDGTLTYTYPLTSRKSYTGILSNIPTTGGIPTNCIKENYDYIDILSKPMISYFSTDKPKIKENYVFTLNAINNNGQGQSSFTNEDILPTIQAPVLPTGPSVPVSPTGPNIPIPPTSETTIDTELLVPNPPQFSINIYQNNIYIFIKYPLSGLGILSYNINLSNQGKVQNAKVYVDSSNNITKTEGDISTFDSTPIPGFTIPQGTIRLSMGKNSLQSGDYVITITATNIYGTSLPTTVPLKIFPPQPTTQPSTSVSKYLIISVIAILIFLIIIAGYFLFKKN